MHTHSNRTTGLIAISALAIGPTSSISDQIAARFGTLKLGLTATSNEGIDKQMKLKADQIAADVGVDSIMGRFKTPADKKEAYLAVLFGTAQLRGFKTIEQALKGGLSKRPALMNLRGKLGVDESGEIDETKLGVDPEMAGLIKSSVATSRQGWQQFATAGHAD